MPCESVYDYRINYENLPAGYSAVEILVIMELKVHFPGAGYGGLTFR